MRPFGEEGDLLIDDDAAEDVEEGDAGWWNGGIGGGTGDVVWEIKYVGQRIFHFSCGYIDF